MERDGAEKKKWAVLMTVHNRVAYTTRCLEHLFVAASAEPQSVHLDVYLTDDGSTDNTAQIVAAQFPSVRILPADGSLFWTKGMVKAWSEALPMKYDAYLLLNNDTFLLPDSMREFIDTQRYMVDHFGTEGIAVGCICQGKRDQPWIPESSTSAQGSSLDSSTGFGSDNSTGTMAHTTPIDQSGNMAGKNFNPDHFITSYGGSVITNRRTLDMRLLATNGTHQLCDFGNANAMLVSRSVVERIGIFWDGYSHGHADYEYTHKARVAGLPVVTTQWFCGVCRNDHQNRMALLARLPLRARWQYLWRPSGYGLPDVLRFLKRNFPGQIAIILYITAKRFCGIDPQRHA